MTDSTHHNHIRPLTPEPPSASTLLPMLIGGLVLIVVGMIAVMLFV
jgi:hypothetical protein